MNKKSIMKLAAVLLSLTLVCGVSAKATIAYLQANAEPVTNTFKPVQTSEDDLRIDVAGTKELKGRDWQEDDNFAFALEKKSGEKWETVTGGTVYATFAGGEGTTRGFDYSKIIESNLSEGTNTFRITETDTGITGVSYDDSVAEFQVDVMKIDTTGALKITDVKNLSNTNVGFDEATGIYKVALGFINKYEAPDDINITIGVEKSVDSIGDKVIGPQGFIFELAEGDLTEGVRERSDVDGNASFDLTFDKDDIGKSYTYKLYEINDGREGVTYDETVYEVQVSIDVNDDNVLVPVVSIDGRQVAAGEYVAGFVNEYDSEAGTDEPDEPSTPSEPGDADETEGTSSTDGDSDDASKTGDEMNIALWIALMIASGAMIVVVLIDRRRRRA